jgi:hypothetical protein
MKGNWLPESNDRLKQAILAQKLDFCASPTKGRFTQFRKADL